MKKWLVGIMLLVMVGCISTKMTLKDNTQMNVDNARVAVALVESFIITGDLDAKHQENVDKANEFIEDIQTLLDNGDEVAAIEKWQDLALLMIDINNARAKAKQGGE